MPDDDDALVGQVRVADAVAQQHDRAQADPARVARGGRGAGAQQATRSRGAVRPALVREEAQAHLHRRAREAIARGLLCRPGAYTRLDWQHGPLRGRLLARPSDWLGMTSFTAPANQLSGLGLSRGCLRGPRPLVRPGFMSTKGSVYSTHFHFEHGPLRGRLLGRPSDWLGMTSFTAPANQLSGLGLSRG